MLASALASLVHAGVPVVEAPDPFLLGGRWRSPLEWSRLAAQAGLTVWPWTWTADDWLPRPEVGDGQAVAVLVVGREAFASVALDETTLGACRRLTALAGRWTLAVELAVDQAGEAIVRQRRRPAGSGGRRRSGARCARRDPGRVILLCGIPSEDPLALVARALERDGAPVSWFDQRAALGMTLDLAWRDDGLAGCLVTPQGRARARVRRCRLHPADGRPRAARS